MQTNNGPVAKGPLRIALGVSLLLLAAGCSSRGTVTGKVTNKGKPLPGGRLLFIHEKKGTFTGMIGPDGGFQIADVPAGQVKIAVLASRPAFNPLEARAKARNRMVEADIPKIKKQMPPEVDEKGLRQMVGLPAAEANQSTVTSNTELFPAKYSDPEKSGLTYTVVGGTQSHDIKLE